MPDNLRAVLNDMDDWIAERGTESTPAVTQADLMKWRTALATALERLDRVERASLSAVDAYLLRPPPSTLPSSASASSTASGRQKHMMQFAMAMATLERELAAARRGEAPSPRHDSRTGSGA